MSLQTDTLLRFLDSQPLLLLLITECPVKMKNISVMVFSLINYYTADAVYYRSYIIHQCCFPSKYRPSTYVVFQ